jgi:uncharacterized protein YhaN
MKLISLYVERFAGLTDQKVDFTDGVNLFFGENESGKSSLCECLLFVFYGLENKAQRIRFIPWDAEDAAASLTLSKDGHVYRAERSVTRSGTDTHRIVDVETGAVVFAEREIWEVFLQIPQVLYRRSAFIGQSESSKIDGRPMESAIENLLIAADETVDTQKAIKRLDDARISLLYKRKNGGRIFAVQQEIERLSAQMRTAQQAQNDLMQQEHLLLQLQANLLQNEKNTEEQTALLEFWEEGKRRTAFLQLNSKEKQANDALQEKEAWVHAHTQNGFFPDLNYINNLKAFQLPLQQKRAQVQDLCSRCDVLEEELRTACVDVAGLEASKSSMKKSIRKKHIGCILVWILAVTLIASPLLLATMPRYARYACFGGAAFSLFFSLFLLWKAHKKEKQLEILYRSWGRGDEESFQVGMDQFRVQILAQQQKRNEYNALLLQRDAQQQELNELETKVRDALSLWGKEKLLETIAKAESVFSQYLTLTHKAELAESELRGYQVLVPVSEEDITQFKTTPYDFPKFESLSGDALRAELSRLGHEKNDLLGRKQACELTLATLRATLRSPADLEEEILRLRKEENALQQTHDALCLASDAICAARDKIRDGLAPHLTARAGELTSRFTGGRYQHLQVSREFSLEYAQNKEQRTHDDSYLSAGTADAAYFSVRLALAQVLFPEPLPLVLDESFCRVDDRRYQNVLHILQEFCQGEQQVLLFTSQGRDIDLAKDILSSQPIILTAK